MIDYLVDIDKDMLLLVNGMNDLFQDAFWWMVSAKWSSMLFLLALLWALLRQDRRHSLLVLVMAVLAILIADQIASGIIKQMVERLRPTHDPSMESAVHVINGYRGGMYGFVSSHASNFFAFSTLVTLVMRHRLVAVSLYTWSLVQCYSRMYLGVHYPSDILGGIIVGLLSGWLVWLLMRWIQRRWHISAGHYTTADAVVMLSALGVTIVGLLIAALTQTL